ncbi:MAG: helix-turn-helix domain-containing protein [Candidatus Moranbacteria bacterium]|nr:helix-turn-helix domain-containing protein [Candidatus Moranbacteria bacterium]
MSVSIDNFADLGYDVAMKQSQILTTIQDAGLSEKGALVYFALLELGGAFPSRVSKHTKLKRSTVYEVLDDLAIKGLVSELEKRGKYFYSIEHPKRLLHFSQRSIAKAEEQYQKLQEFLPGLEGMYAGITNKPKVSYFEGTDGVMEIYEDHISGKKKYEMIGFVNIAEIMQFLPEKKYRDYVRIKEKLGITTRGILPDTTADRAYEKTAYMAASKKILPQVRFISKEEFPWKGDITIYAENKVSIISFDQQKVSGIIIESETIHRMMRMIFELAWKGALVK